MVFRIVFGYILLPNDFIYNYMIALGPPVRPLQGQHTAASQGNVFGGGSQVIAIAASQSSAASQNSANMHRRLSSIVQTSTLIWILIG